MGDGTVRHVCFTVFHKLSLTINDPDGLVRYCCYQGEHAPSTGEFHFQGYIELNEPCRLRQLRSILGVGASDVHFERRRGTRDQARAYCLDRLKPGVYLDEPPVEYGRWRASAARTGRASRLATACEHLAAGRRVPDVALEDLETFARYAKSYDRISAMVALRQPATFLRKEVKLYIGPTGCGKTRKAYEEHPSLYRVPSARSGGIPWFDGYAQEEAILFDDFNGEAPITWILQLTDGYPIQGEVKGSHVVLRPKIIIFTSNTQPKYWWINATAEHHAAFERRITLKKTTWP